MKKLNYYKIQDTKTQLFSSGGAIPTFSKNGKIWTKQSLASHLSIVKKCDAQLQYKDCKLIAYKLTKCRKQHEDEVVLKFEKFLFESLI